MLAPFRKKAETADTSDRVRAWTRERFALPEDAAIMVAEIECQVPGCPPLETVIAFWEPGDETKRYHFKVFKPVAEVDESDLPPSWLKPGLLGEPMFGCPCC